MSGEYIPWLAAGAAISALMVFKRLGQISSKQARELVKSGAKLVDVRSPAEFVSGHIPGAVNMPVNEIGWRFEHLGAKDKPVIVYCASGTRSALARSVLKGKGFAHVFNLGSMNRW